MSEQNVVAKKSFFPTDRSLYTPFNVVCGVILLVGLLLTVMRFTGGLAAVTNLDDNYPWGLWIGFDLMAGVALAAGGYTTSAACYIFGIKRFHSAVRPAILTGFLGYALVVVSLNYDVGRPWRLPYPFVVQRGTTSLLFEVAACVALYLTVLFLEYSPAALEWLGFKKLRNTLVRITMVLTIFGVVLSTLHQSSLGALFLIAPSKLHPFWYSTYIPVYFFISSIIAGLSMVIFEGTLSHKYFHDKMDATYRSEHDGLVLGFAKGASFVMAGYVIIKIIGIAVENQWHLLATPYGLWFLVELIGFVALPCYLYAVGARDKNLKLIQRTSIIAVLGIILNRLNVCIIAFNWYLPWSQKYIPHWGEVGLTIFMLTVGVLVFRFIVTRQPIFYEHPEYQAHHAEDLDVHHKAQH
ncbi:sulfate respiration complex protein HmcC [Desulfococcus multivorans]|uniref:Polysulfide reductase NrfD n=1 Tax=Desulfococcus multivorans DSM 2059 TaxID=1121405 RepID=S7V1P0_DESML|nr:Ni/Fe-hydrogenase cytochrome b subunit [Desulfococcus multivorans]AOY57587.1 HmcC: HMC redox complex, integral membrane protein [Desulfococcus multivorans]AQU99996.1 Ni/Fe-hydrogenase cytochrome b subunit [Desulfococcus multivorans]EPR40419.1 Polysulfide reductase NrfD [Desulfococcus multivorans DSM 2059]SJZ76288.1 Ni/Fe-hydrogenase 2 integral membrane subunit HybB [Desulfococcus multivorans DSM 2059]